MTFYEIINLYINGILLGDIYGFMRLGLNLIDSHRERKVMQTVKDRVLVETGYLGANVSCISTKKGLVLIDSPMLPEDAKDWAQRIRHHTGQEIAFLINTDHHFDHVMGNSFLTDRIICHATAAKGIKFLRQKEELKKIVVATFAEIPAGLEEEMKDLRIDAPLITFDRSLTLDMGNGTLILEFVGGHSPGTILIHLVEDRVVFTGDNVETQFPYLGQCRFPAWKKILQKILSMDIDWVVPGHGHLGGKELVEKYFSFFQKLEEEINHFKIKGFPVEKMVKETQLLKFFPKDETVKEEMPQSWIEEQYKAVARQVLEGER